VAADPEIAATVEDRRAPCDAAGDAHRDHRKGRGRTGQRGDDLFVFVMPP